jgi:hypothetical protein
MPISDSPEGTIVETAAGSGSRHALKLLEGFPDSGLPEFRGACQERLKPDLRDAQLSALCPQFWL